MLTKKNSQATAILATICHKMEQNQFNSLMKEAYVNGREQGFSLVNQLMNGQPQVVFAEARTSDQIVVYCSRSGFYYSPFNCTLKGITPKEI